MKKNKKKLKIWSAIIILVLVIIGTLFYFSTKPVSETYFLSKSMGLISIKTYNSWFSLNQQTADFSKTTATVGDPIAIHDTFTSLTAIPIGQCLSYYEVIVTAPDGTTSKTPVNYNPCKMTNFPSALITTINPTQVGTYTVKTDYYTGTGIPNTPGVTKISESGLNSLAVSAAACTKVWTSYTQDPTSTITNGVIEKRTNNCDSDVEYRTSCDNGYQIVGTTVKIATGKKTCEIVPASGSDCVATPSLCTSTQSCDPTTKTCVAHQCDVDEVTTCLNGQNVTTKKCTNFVLVDNAACPGANSSTNGSNSNNSGTANPRPCYVIETSINSTKTCVVKTITAIKCSGTNYEDKLDCDAALNPETENNWGLIIGVGTVGLLGVIAFYVWWMRRKR